MMSIADAPLNCVLLIYSNLDVRGLLQASGTCRRLYSITRVLPVWREMMARLFPEEYTSIYSRFPRQGFYEIFLFHAAERHIHKACDGISEDSKIIWRVTAVNVSLIVLPMLYDVAVIISKFPAIPASSKYANPELDHKYLDNMWLYNG